jgi:hypothetical protein
MWPSYGEMWDALKLVLKLRRWRNACRSYAPRSIMMKSHANPSFQKSPSQAHSISALGHNTDEDR